MAFDGVTLACLCRELTGALLDARIMKIAQTERDELILTLRPSKDSDSKGQLRLLLSAQASLPLVSLIPDGKKAPEQAPAFCMLLRKYLQNGRILSVTQPSLERVLRFAVSHYDEMGDLKTYTLIIELMGKHSNIILIDERDVILDAIKHVPPTVSSVREVLPGRPYFLPDTLKKRDPHTVADVVTLTEVLGEKEGASPELHDLLVKRLTGISPVMAEELCARAKADPSAHFESLDYETRQALTLALTGLMEDVRKGCFAPRIYLEGNKMTEFAALPLQIYEEAASANQDEGGSAVRTEEYPDMSSLLIAFYAGKNRQSRIRNKSADLRQQVATILARTVRKYDQQMQQMKDTEKRDKYRLRGELLTAYAHEIEAGAKEARVTDYHTGKEVTIPLDPTLSATDNAAKCFERYARMKRTYENLSVLTKEVEEEIAHLTSVKMALDLATEETELAEIKRELTDGGYLKGKSTDRGKKGQKKKPAKKEAEEKSTPLHYVTSDGLDVFVGKNNAQNDALTFHGQGKGDWWFHAKNMPGSHVVLRAGEGEIPDRSFEEAASLAAYYSAGRENGKVEIDYTELKNVKKPAKAKPGFVVYYTNYSMVADADISALSQTGRSRSLS